MKSLQLMITVPETSKILIEAGIKPSSQRIAVMRQLMSDKSHPTVADIYDALIPEHPTISRTTIYNTLKLFVETGCARCLSIDPINARFDATVRPHAHFFCRKCHRVTDIEMPLPPLHIQGYSCDSAALFFTGVCPHCNPC